MWAGMRKPRSDLEETTTAGPRVVKGGRETVWTAADLLDRIERRRRRSAFDVPDNHAVLVGLNYM